MNDVTQEPVAARVWSNQEISDLLAERDNLLQLNGVRLKQIDSLQNDLAKYHDQITNIHEALGINELKRKVFALEGKLTASEELNNELFDEKIDEWADRNMQDRVEQSLSNMTNRDFDSLGILTDDNLEKEVKRIFENSITVSVSVD